MTAHITTTAFHAGRIASAVDAVTGTVVQSTDRQQRRINKRLRQWDRAECTLTERTRDRAHIVVL